MSYIRKVATGSGATAVQIVHKNAGQIVKLEHIGSAHSDDELRALMMIAKKRLLGTQQSLFNTQQSDKSLHIKLGQTTSQLLMDCLNYLANELGLDSLDDDLFVLLCIARVVEPTSKLDALRVLAELGVSGHTNTGIHRCLGRVITRDYRNKLARLCFTYASSQQDGITLVLYVVTTLYFEIQKEDEDNHVVVGYRKPGMSKERRLEPQIVVGLLVDQNGFPLELHSFEGNKAETKTIVPVMNEFRQRHGLVGLTVVADAGMLSAENLSLLHKAGYSYIVGSRMNKIPYGIAKFQKSGRSLVDGQIISAETAVTGQRIIYQYRAKRATLDLHNITKQIAKAEAIVNGKASAKKAKFLVSQTKNKSLNKDLIEKAKKLAGIKGYVTNLPTTNKSDMEIINYYHQLWHVEQSFRMSKNDLRARPIFHHKKDAIEAHLTIVMASLAIGRIIEKRTGLGIKRFVKLLRPIRSGTVIISGKSYSAEPQIPKEINEICKQIFSGH